MRGSRCGRVGALAALVVLLVACAPAWGHGKPEPPKRVLILVIDQFRPDYVDTFDMRNVRKLMRDGVSFDNAYLGHMASETVITHNVITSGRCRATWAGPTRPLRDRRQRARRSPRTRCGSPARSPRSVQLADRARQLPQAPPTTSKQAHPGTKFIAAGQKNYAVHSPPTGRPATSR